MAVKMLQGARLFVENVVRSQSLLEGNMIKRWCTASHTLAVKKKIDSTRERAMLGGGQRRIDKQHQKVSSSVPPVRDVSS